MPAYRTDYEHYNLSHNNFVSAYKLINEYVTDLYMMPKHFSEEAGRVMDVINREYAIPQAPEKSNETFRAVLDFVKQLDAFTLHTINLFNEHKTHIDCSEVYMSNVERMRNGGQVISDLEYSELAEEVNELLNGLRTIKEKADKTIVWLDQLDFSWESIKEKLG
jgi:hypothetical protein